MKDQHPAEVNEDRRNDSRLCEDIELTAMLSRRQFKAHLGC